MWGKSEKPVAHPARKRGTAERKKPNVYFFSVRVSAGRKNANAWYSQTGLETTTPANIAIFILSSNAPLTLS